jgi:hypothetical protein
MERWDCMTKNKVPESERKLIDIAKIAASEVLKEYAKEQNRKDRNYWFGRTKLLLENYDDLKNHIAKAKDCAMDVINSTDDVDLQGADPYFDNEYDIDMLASAPDIFISSIKRNRVATIVIMSHIDTNLKLLSLKSSKDGGYDKYRLMKQIYFHGEEFPIVADQFHISEATARRWANDMIRQLSVLMFGMSGIQLR